MNPPTGLIVDHFGARVAPSSGPPRPNGERGQG